MRNLVPVMLLDQNFMVVYQNSYLEAIRHGDVASGHVDQQPGNE
jgi:hypothetical protein